MKTLKLAVAIVKGGFVTARHFFANMGRRTLRLFGLRTRRPGAVTFQYPERPKPVAARHRSLHRLTRRPDGTPRCVACMLCVTVCPSECIFVEAVEVEDPEIQKAPRSFVIDLGRCSFCGFCVEACPVDAIRMDTGRLESAAATRDGLLLVLEKRP